MNKVFLYARKSTDEDDRQILSIESQLTELRELAQKENLTIVEEFLESKTAKVPGRPLFNDMMAQIEKGKADGILSWHPDRLARNSVDGGQVIYLLDIGKLQSLKFPTFWFDNTPQGKFMLNIAFGQSKYYIDNLRENILRGFRQKIRRGEFPHFAPLGYLNDLRTHTIVIDPDKAPLVRKMFETYATGRHAVSELRDLMESWGLRRSSTKIAISHVHDLLSNPFYVGLMRLKGEVYQGSHEPLISKSLFDKVQALLHERSKPRYKPKNRFPLLGLLKCATCGCSVTAEQQKGHHYYHCTKKRGPCPEPYIREEALAQQLRDILKQISLPELSREPINQKLDAYGKEASDTYHETKRSMDQKIAALNDRLKLLLDTHLDGAIARDEYLSHKEALLHEKLALQEELARLKNQGNRWLEPARRLFNAAFEAHKLGSDENLEKISGFFKNIGSNLRLAGRTPQCFWDEKFSILVNFNTSNTNGGGRTNHFLISKEPDQNQLQDGAKNFSILGDFERNSLWWAIEDLNL